MADDTSPAPNRPGSPGFTPEELALFKPDLRADDVECRANPTKIDRPYWKYMIARGRWAYSTRRKYDMIARKGAWLNHPIYCFDRFGRTETRLPDGRLVYIAGEHEDFYDPDFCIYNDVVVVHGYGDKKTENEVKADADAEARAGEDSDSEAELDEDPEVAALQKKMWEADKEHDRKWTEYVRREDIKEDLKTAARARGASPHEIDIYCYPHSVFPPTDFHTATYVKDEGLEKEYIYVIGGLGYGGGPHRAATMTYRLDLEDFSMQRMETSGDGPPPRRDGTKVDRTADWTDGSIRFMHGKDEYVLDLADMRWSNRPPGEAGVEPEG